jgi:hypothetical protein
MNIFQEAKQILDKDGKVNPLGPYGKSKLTGQEVAQYFRKNKVSDSKIKKAVEVALDLGGAMDIARKEIKKFYGDKILKSKEVQGALKFANEEVIGEGKGSDIFKKYGSIINRLSDKEKDEVIELLYTMNTQSGRRYKEAFGKVKELLNMEYIPEDSDMAINPKTINKTKPMLMKYAKKFGVDLEFGYKGRMPSLLQIKSKSSQAEKGFLDAVGKDKQLMKLLDHVEYENEEVITENYRTLAQKGMGTESEKDARVGLELDFYDSKGNKQFGKIVKKDRKGYTVKDKKGKMHTFTFLDRQKAKKLLVKTDKLSNIIKKNTIKKGKFAGYMTDEVNEIFGISQDPRYRAKVMKMLDDEGIKYKKDGRNALIILGVAPKDQKKLLDRIHKEFGMSSYSMIDEGAFSVKLNKPYKRGDEKMYMDIIKKYGGKNLKFSPPKGRDLELDITFDGGDVKKIKSNLPNKGKDSEWISEGGKSAAQQAAIAISKKEKAGKPGYDKEGKSLKKESVMDTYRQMWEDGQKYAPKLELPEQELKEKLSATDLKFIDMMYDKKGKLTDVGKAVMNYKPGDNIRKIVQNLNNKK